MNRYTPGTILRNGATVCKVGHGPEGEILLCRWDDSLGRERWVTWSVSRSGEPVVGNYFTQIDDGHEPLADAFRDFRRRVAGRIA